MKAMSPYAVVAFALACLLMTACSGTPVKTRDANSYVDTANVDFSEGRKISASSSGFQLLLLIPININVRHKRAFQALMDEADNDYITDIKIEESWTYALVGTVYKTTFEAMAYPMKTD